MAKKIDGVIREFYRPAPETAHIVDYSDNPQYWADGETAEEIIQEIAGVEAGVADAVATYLSADEFPDVKDGGDAYYDKVPLEHIAPPDSDIAKDFNLGGRGHRSLVKDSGASTRGR